MSTLKEKEKINKLFEAFFDCSFKDYEVDYYEKAINDYITQYIQFLTLPLLKSFIITVLVKDNKNYILKQDFNLSKSFLSENEAIEYYTMLKRG